MEHTYGILGMTCQGCATSVKQSLYAVDAVEEAKVDLENAVVTLRINGGISLKTLQESLPKKYQITEKQHQGGELLENPTKSKIAQLKPLFLIFAYLLTAVILLNYKDLSIQDVMLDFMGLFYVVFSFFKLLDLKGFSESFRMYDPLAKAIPVYGLLYPFLELTLGLFFLMRFQVTIALLATLFILSSTTLGVTKTLLYKKNIRCACLGTALKLPMTEATLIENTVMLVMAFSMLILQ